MSDHAVASVRECPEPPLLVGDSEPMRLLRRTIRRLAPLPAPVLIIGETGSGKELAARALHEASPRVGGPLVAVNAAAIPHSLAGSELFGHERGAFTGAERRHAGAFEQAHRGTLFLDEVADLPLDLQAWLLRVLETREVRRLGARVSRHVDVRVIAATHVDLGAAVRRGHFRADLYFRLAVLELHVPPLRERLEDLAVLSRHLLSRLGLPDEFELSPGALQALALHAWPGNVRELRAVLLRAAAFAHSTTLDAPDIVVAIGRGLRQRSHRSRLEEMGVAEALADSYGNVSKAARRLGVPRTTLRDHLRARRRQGSH